MTFVFLRGYEYANDKHFDLLGYALASYDEIRYLHPSFPSLTTWVLSEIMKIIIFLTIRNPELIIFCSAAISFTTRRRCPNISFQSSEIERPEEINLMFLFCFGQLSNFCFGDQNDIWILKS
jgi:hypothetical protein